MRYGTLALAIALAGMTGSAANAEAWDRTNYKIECTTNTGNSLMVEGSEALLTPRSGRPEKYQIVDESYLSLESFPPQDQYSLRLNDGRGLTFIFSSVSNNGRGYWNRLDGSTSPEFGCTRTAN